MHVINVKILNVSYVSITSILTIDKKMYRPVLYTSLVYALSAYFRPLIVPKGRAFDKRKPTLMLAFSFPRERYTAIPRKKENSARVFKRNFGKNVRYHKEL